MSLGALPISKRILDDLEDRIASGEIVDRFPTDQELVEYYGVSRPTVREAVDVLQARGLIERHRGRGSFVRSERVRNPLGLVNDLYRAAERAGRSQEYRLVRLEERTNAEVAARLDLLPDADLVNLERVRYIGSEPAVFDSTWLPSSSARDILDIDPVTDSLYDALEERCGIRLTSVREVIEPCLPRAEVRRRLAIKKDDPVYRLVRCGMVGGTPVEWREAFVANRGFVLQYSWNRARVVEPVSFGAREALGLGLSTESG